MISFSVINQNQTIKKQNKLLSFGSNKAFLKESGFQDKKKNSLSFEAILGILSISAIILYAVFTKIKNIPQKKINDLLDSSETTASSLNISYTGKLTPQKTSKKRKTQIPMRSNRQRLVLNQRQTTPNNSLSSSILRCPNKLNEFKPINDVDEILKYLYFDKKLIDKMTTNEKNEYIKTVLSTENGEILLINQLKDSVLKENMNIFFKNSSSHIKSLRQNLLDGNASATQNSILDYAKQVHQHTLKTFVHAPQDLLTKRENELSNKFIPLGEFINHKAGVCRHRAGLVDCLFNETQKRLYNSIISDQNAFQTMLRNNIGRVELYIKDNPSSTIPQDALQKIKTTNQGWEFLTNNDKHTITDLLVKNMISCSPLNQGNHTKNLITSLGKKINLDALYETLPEWIS